MTTQGFEIPNRKILRAACQGVAIALFVLFGALGSAFFAQVNPSTSLRFLWLALPLIAIEAHYSNRFAQERMMFFQELYIFRFSEAITLLLVLKAFSYFGAGVADWSAELANWENTFFTAFFTLDYLGFVALGALTWFSTSLIDAEIEELFNREDEGVWEDVGKMRNSIREIRARLIGQFSFLGFLACFFAIGALRYKWYMGLEISGPGRIVLFGVVLYFALILVLMSVTQFVQVKTAWMKEKTVFPAEISKAWILWTLLSLGLIAVIVPFLPTSYTLGLLSSIRLVLNFLLDVFALVIQLVLFPFLAFASLFKGCTRAPEEETNLSPQNVFTPPDQTLPGPSWFEALKSILFWAALLGLAGYALFTYINANRAGLGSLFHIRGLAGLKAWWRAFWKNFTGAANLITDQISSQIKRWTSRVQAALPHSPRNWTSTRSLDARHKVRFYYLNFLKVAGERGYSRSSAQTPLAFYESIKDHLPESDAELEDLTQSFLVARYSRQEIPETFVEQARRRWQNILRAIKNLKED